MSVSSAIGAGVCAAAAAVFAKLAIDLREGTGLPRLLCLWMAQAQDLDGTVCTSDSLAGDAFTISDQGVTWQQLAWLMRLVCLGLVFASNALMWALFTKALASSSSSVYATVINSAANFLCTALLGILLFQEPVTWQWGSGALLIVAGVLLMHKGLARAAQPKQKKQQ